MLFQLYTDVMMAYCTSLSVRRFRSRDEVYVYKFVYNGGFKSDWTLTKEALMNTSCKVVQAYVEYPES